MPLTYATSAGSADAGDLAPEAAGIPFRIVMGNEREFSGEDPPLTRKGQEAALHMEPIVRSLARGIPCLRAC